MASLQDVEVMLFDAITSGNLPHVKRLVSSGMGRNAILHTPQRWEGATVLSTAAFIGNLQLVRYLVETGASVNLQDPGLHRNALHWACMGPSIKVVQYLIDRGADVNALDRDNMSPLLYAAVHRHQEAVEVLVLAGANVHHVDRLRCSALHYTAFHGDPVAVSAIIRAGCIHSNAIFGKGTPLANLVSHGDTENVHLLLVAGYHLTSNDWMTAIRLHKDSQIMKILLQHSRVAPSLKQLCRTTIRASMNGVNLQKKVGLLPLPHCLIQYLLLDKDFVEQEKI